MVFLFFYGNTVIVDMVDLPFQLRQLMIMRGKKGPGPQQLFVADVFYNGPRST